VFVLAAQARAAFSISVTIASGHSFAVWLSGRRGYRLDPARHERLECPPGDAPVPVSNFDRPQFFSPNQRPGVLFGPLALFADLPDGEEFREIGGGVGE
jgi:hypothetical protein